MGPARWALAGSAFAVVACCVGAAVAGCSKPPPSAAPARGDNDAEWLIVSLPDVRHITRFEGLSPYEYADRDRPFEENPAAPGPCRAVGSSERTFSGGWKQFRTVTYSGTTDDLRPINEVSHAVAVYPDARIARAAMARLESTLHDCASLHDNAFDFALNKPDPSTVKLGSTGWSHLYRVKSSVLVSVGVLGIEPTEQVANTVLQTITDRIK